jgi:hypothetical protein
VDIGNSVSGLMVNIITRLHLFLRSGVLGALLPQPFYIFGCAYAHMFQLAWLELSSQPYVRSFGTKTLPKKVFTEGDSQGSSWKGVGDVTMVEGKGKVVPVLK